MKEDQKCVYDLFAQVISLRVHGFEIQSSSGLIINFSQDVNFTPKAENTPWYFWFYTTIWRLESSGQILIKNSDSPEKIQNELEKLRDKKLLEVEVPSDKYDVKLMFEKNLVFHLMAEDYIDCNIPVKIQKIETEAYI